MLRPAGDTLITNWRFCDGGALPGSHTGDTSSLSFLAGEPPCWVDGTITPLR